MTEEELLVARSLGWSCWRCKTAHTFSASVTVTGMSGLFAIYCHKCAGYKSLENGMGGFEWQKEYWIRASVPLHSDTPKEIVADWLEENGKLEAAQYIRGLCSGR